MARDATKTLTTVASSDETVPEAIGQRKKLEAGRFLLQVDRQTKSSYTTAEAAEQAGLAIKKGHPIVRVAIYDTVDCVSKVIEIAPPA